MNTVLQAKVQWITTAEAAEIIGCTKIHVALLIREEKIRAEKFGTTWAIDRKSAEEFARIPQKTGRPRVSQSA